LTQAISSFKIWLSLSRPIFPPLKIVTISLFLKFVLLEIIAARLAAPAGSN